MIVVMVINFYMSRVVLDVLGGIDFGSDTAWLFMGETGGWAWRILQMDVVTTKRRL